jgi:hypothetical protein
MKLFNTLMSKIFGGGAPTAGQKSDAPAGNPPGVAAPPPPVGNPPGIAAPPPPVGNPPGIAAAPPPAVDVASVLDGLSAKSSEKLDWKKSIVDLMKLVGMDSSLSARKELATELGYTGDQNDSAAMNIWLHKQVMKKLAENGGKVPADLLD